MPIETIEIGKTLENSIAFDYVRLPFDCVRLIKLTKIAEVKIPHKAILSKQLTSLSLSLCLSVYFESQVLLELERNLNYGKEIMKILLSQ